MKKSEATYIRKHLEIAVGKLTESSIAPAIKTLIRIDRFVRRKS